MSDKPGWRVGKVVPVDNPRLPELNGKTFTIRRVKGQIVYTIDFGDFPFGDKKEREPR